MTCWATVLPAFLGLVLRVDCAGFDGFLFRFLVLNATAAAAADDDVDADDQCS